jgi:hypothetical protein
MAWVNFTSFDTICGANPGDFLVGYIDREEKKYPVYALKNGLSAGEWSANSLRVTENANISGNLAVATNATILGNLSVFGEYSVVDTITTLTSALSIINIGTGPALTVKQTGVQPIAQFFDDNDLALLVDDGGNTGFGEKPNERVTVSGNISAKGNLYLTDSSFTSGNSFTLGNNAVSGMSFLADTVYLSGNQYMQGRLYCNSFARFGGNIRGSTFLCITGDSLIGGNSYTNLSSFVGGESNITGNQTLSSDLLVAGSSNINTNLKVGGTLWATGDVTLSGNQYARGHSYVNGDSYVDGVSNLKGNVTLSGNEYVAGSEYINTNLYVGGNTLANGSLTQLGNANLSSNLAVTNNANFLKNTTTNKLSVIDGLSATGFSFFDGNVLFNDPVTYNDTLTLNYDLSVGRTLFVNGSAALGNSPDDKVFVAGAIYGTNKLQLGNVGPGGQYIDPLSALVVSNDFNNTNQRYNKLVLLNDAETLIPETPSHIVEFVQNVDADRGPIAKVQTRSHQASYAGDHNDLEVHINSGATGANNLSAVVIINQGGNIHLGQKTTNTVNVSGNLQAGNSIAAGNGTFANFTPQAGSIAVGKNSYASGLYSLAQGFQCSAYGDYSFASGRDCVAFQDRAMAQGRLCWADGATAMAFGRNATSIHSRTMVFAAAGAVSTTFLGNVSSTRSDQILLSASSNVYLPGKVSIGVDSIANELTVNGNLSTTNLFTAALTSRSIDLLHLPANDGSWPTLRIGETDLSSGNKGFSGVSIAYNESANYFGLSCVYTDNPAINAVAIDRLGRVGLGIDNPTQKLTVTGNISASGGLSASNIYIDKDDVNLIGEVQTFVNPATATGDFLVLNINGTNRALRLWSFTS